MSDEYFEAQASAEPVDGLSRPVWELSGWWRRVGAAVLDYLIVWIPVTMVLSIAGISAEATTISSLPNELDGVSWLVMLIASSIYFMVTMSAWNGQTVGKRVTGIRVVRESGEPVDAKFAFVRQTLVIALLFNSIAIMLLFIPTVLNYLWPLWDEKHQALHDKIVKSRVVRAARVRQPGTGRRLAREPAKRRTRRRGRRRG